MHRTQGLRAIWQPDFPQWLDEGLAMVLSNETRFAPQANPEWVFSLTNFSKWRRHTRQNDWKEAYSAAWSVVRHVEQAHGRKALRELVMKVEAGAKFAPLWQTLYQSPPEA